LIIGFILLVRGGGTVFHQQSTGDVQPDSLRRRTIHFAVIILAVNLLLLAWYVLSSFASWFYVRYVATAAVVASLLIAGTVLHLCRQRRWIMWVYVAVGVLPLCASVVLLHLGRAYNQYHDVQCRLVEEFVPPGELVAARQTGTLGYFRDHIVNLDGKVNPEAYRARSTLREYLRQKEVRWLCDWEWMIADLVEPTPSVQGRWQCVARRGEFVLYHFEASPR
jgi:hypothetical protein